MKKFISLMLAVCLTLGLFGCGKEAAQQAPNAETNPPETTQAAAAFSVGFGRGDITPDVGIQLGGYGGNNRACEGVLDYLYSTCVAIRDDQGNTVLVMTSDMVRGNWADELRKAVSDATGLPVENVIHATTHTHSGAEPLLEAGYQVVVSKAMVKAAQDALEDLSPATAEIGSSHVENMSFVRHYVSPSGAVFGDNFGEGTPVRHTTEADDLLQVIRFNREGKKPVVMINWQGHPTLASTGSDESKAKRLLASADYVGACRQYVEQEGDCLFAFYLSGSGNLNAYSRIAGEGVKSHTVYGEKLGKAVMDVLGNMTAVETGTVQCTEKVYEGKSPTGEPAKTSYSGIATGDISFVTSQFEMFDTNARNIKDNTPFKMTFVLTLTNGRFGYMPTQECWDYPGCYEVESCKLERGGAEIMEENYMNLLAELKG